MPEAPIPYRKVRGAGRGTFERVRLFFAPDHLLQVKSTGYSETYSRFYFRDIQAIQLRQTPFGTIITGALAGFTVLFAFAALMTDDIAQIVWAAFFGVCLVLLAVNFFRGPTCDCQIRTAVQTRRLDSLNRLKQAQKFLAQIKPEIDAVQGVLPPEEVARRLDLLRQTGALTDTLQGG